MVLYTNASTLVATLMAWLSLVDTCARSNPSEGCPRAPAWTPCPRVSARIHHRKEKGKNRTLSSLCICLWHDTTETLTGQCQDDQRR
jgi:hypothetical protein